MTDITTPWPPDPRFAFLDPSFSVDPDAFEERLRSALAPNLQLVRQIGAGGMARVFLAREPALKRLVAVKVLSAELAALDDARLRFEREAQAVAGLSHPNIVSVHSVGEMADGTPYFVMQHVSGRSLAARLEDEGPFSVADARRSLAEVAAALATAHEQGIVHRDIKPANILHEEATGRSLVTDFGIAAVGPTADVNAMRLTGTGMIIGTPQYMSPEQLLAEPVSEKTDIYSLGLLAHELLVGSSPFRASSPNELIAAHLRDTPERLATRRTDVDPELDAVIARCLEKDAEKRPSADEVARRLSPGGVALLEWPPPGLRELHGTLRRVSTRYWLGGSLVLAAMIPSVLVGTRLKSGIVSPVSLLLPLLAVGGFVLLIGAIRGSARLGRETARAVRGGYGWMSVLETLADHTGDTGNVISGSREYAAPTPSERSELRRGRVMRELLLFASGMLMVPLFMLVVALGSIGYAPPGAVWAAVVVPMMAAIAAVVLGIREQRAFAARRQRPTSALEVDTAKLSAPWYQRFEAVRRNQSLGRGSTKAPLAGWVAAVVAGIVIATMIVLLVPIMLAGAIGPTFWSLMVPRYANTKAKFEIASISRPLEVARDPNISALDAGRAFYAIQMDGADTSHTRFAELSRPTPRMAERPWSSPFTRGLVPDRKA